jgi:hypothetical protein
MFTYLVRTKGYDRFDVVERQVAVKVCGEGVVDRTQTDAKILGPHHAAQAVSTDGLLLIVRYTEDTAPAGPRFYGDMRTKEEVQTEKETTRQALRQVRAARSALKEIQGSGNLFAATIAQLDDFETQYTARVSTLLWVLGET